MKIDPTTLRYLEANVKQDAFDPFIRDWQARNWEAEYNRVAETTERRPKRHYHRKPVSLWALFCRALGRIFPTTDELSGAVNKLAAGGRK